MISTMSFDAFREKVYEMTSIHTFALNRAEYRKNKKEDYGYGSRQSYTGEGFGG